MRKLLLGTALVACSALGFQASDAAAQGLTVQQITPTGSGEQQTFIVPFLCGGVDAGTDDGAVFGPGNYLTAINVLNQGDARTGLRIRVVESLPGTAGVGDVGALTRTLFRGRAIQIDCADIAEVLNGTGTGDGGGGGTGSPQAAQTAEPDSGLHVVASYSQTPADAGGGVGADGPLSQGFVIIQRIPGTGTGGTGTETGGTGTGTGTGTDTGTGTGTGTDAGTGGTGTGGTGTGTGGGA